GRLIPHARLVLLSAPRKVAHMATLERQLDMIRKVMGEAVDLDGKLLGATRLYLLAVNLTSLMQMETHAWEEAQQYESACGSNLLSTLNEYIDARIAAAMRAPRS